MTKVYRNKLVTAVVKRCGICRPTVEVVLTAVFDEIRWQLSEGKQSVPIDSFGTFAVVNIPERQRHYVYRGLDEIRTLPPKLKIKFAPARCLRNDVESGTFDPTRTAFIHHPGDPHLRGKAGLSYNHRKEISLRRMDLPASPRRAQSDPKDLNDPKDPTAQ